MACARRPSMKLIRSITLLAGLTGVVLPPLTHAVAYFGTYSATLWNTPAEFFTADDWKLFEDTLRSTLNSQKDGGTTTWSNPATRASGEFTILKSVMKGEQVCREVKIINASHDRRRVTGVAFCKEDDGNWKAVSGR